MRKIYYLKVRLTQVEHEALVEHADAASLTISEYARIVFARDRERIDIDEVLASIRAHLAASDAITPTASRPPDPLLVETVWLLRELAAERNTETLFRVASKLDSAYGRQRTKI